MATVNFYFFSSTFLQLNVTICNYRERERLELELETTQFEATFSRQLLELMQREDDAGSQVNNEI